MKLVDRDGPFTAALNEQAGAAERVYSSINAGGFPPLDDLEVTSAILNRMSTFARAQDRLKKLLNKRYAAPAADFFVETVLFFLSLYCKSVNPLLEVHSERQLRPERGQMRPDISIWRGDEVIAIIECKTQLGWNRGNWERDFQDRERRLKTEFPHGRAFLLVLTEENWEGFTGNREGLGSQYFVLLKKGVNLTDVNQDNLTEKIVHRIEDLFSQLLVREDTDHHATIG